MSRMRLHHMLRGVCLIALLCAGLIGGTTASAQTANLVTNGDFGGGAQPWNTDALSGVETCCAYNSGGFSGGAVPNAFGHPNGAGGITALWQNIPNPQAGSYTLTGWIKTSGGAQNALIQADDGTGHAYCISQQQRNPTAWLQVSCAFTLASPATIHVALIAANDPSTAWGWIAWDNISLTRGSSGGTASIGGLSPAPPQCVLRSAASASSRTLVVTGSNFPYPHATENLQFRRVDTLAESIYIGSQVNWQSTTQVSLDMSTIASLLWSDARLALQVRFTRYDSTTGGQVAISNWSSAQFLLANDSAACGGGSVSIPLPVPFISQYQGLSSSNCDCGPASIAMILRYYGKGAGLSDQALVGQVRNATGNLSACTGPNFPADTTFAQLERAIGSYGLRWSEISNAATPQPTPQMQAMKDATNAGKPVIALINAVDLGRSYTGHWVVVLGFSADGQTVYINDADNQGAKSGYPNWFVGGANRQLSYATFSKAAVDAPAGPYGIIVSNT